MKKKIAIVHDRMNIGGTEKVMINMLKSFDYGKYDVTLWLLKDDGGLQKDIPSAVNVRLFSNDSVKIKSLIRGYCQKRKYISVFKALYHKWVSRKNIDNFYENMVNDIYSLPLINDEEYYALFVYQGLYLNLPQILFYFL